MDDLDSLLSEAGERWRASQPPPPSIDDLSLVDARSRPSLVWPVVGAGAVITVMLVVAIWTQIVNGPGTGSVGPAASAAASAANFGGACVTRPNPPFIAPSPYPPSPPRDHSAWFGTPQLWTMLDLDGNVLSRHSEKTFWWSSDWQPRDEPEPAITVVGTRLDGPGTFRFGPGTNANASDLGGWAMLVSVGFPTPGCWQLTAEYRGAVLSYVAWIK